ncbi:MAG: putative ubiquitin carboxyl-terminal hydrolase family protein, partial [Streblomastix strix]
MENQREEYDDLLSDTPKRDQDTWYILAKTWKDIFFKQSKVPPIDNSKLIKPQTSELLPGLIERKDYLIVPEKLWNQLIQWFGGGPHIARKMRKVGNGYVVDLYPKQIKFSSKSDSSSSHKELLISQYDTPFQVTQNIKDLFGIQKDQQLQLWKNDQEQINFNEVKNILNVFEGIEVVLVDSSDVPNQQQSKQEDNKVVNKKEKENQRIKEIKPQSTQAQPKTPQKEQQNTTQHQENFINKVQKTDSQPKSIISTKQINQLIHLPKNPGIVGLTNLGFTCYMNAALQCLLQVPPLNIIFLSRRFLHDLNIDNPIGKKGQMAGIYSDLVDRIWGNINLLLQTAEYTQNKEYNEDNAVTMIAKWEQHPTGMSQIREQMFQEKLQNSIQNVYAGAAGSGPGAIFTPKAFKFAISCFNNQFEGMQQCDAQELLNTIIDLLHEDLNRVKKKPYVEGVDEEEPDLETAMKMIQQNLLTEHQQLNNEE